MNRSAHRAAHALGFKSAGAIQPLCAIQAFGREVAPSIYARSRTIAARKTPTIAKTVWLQLHERCILFHCSPRCDRLFGKACQVEARKDL